MARPVVGIVMGSDSDLPVMRAAYETLQEFGVPAEVRVISAHRTPEDAMAYAREAAGNGMKVLIAAAGGAAHLAGVLAAGTPLPVIAVPMALQNLQGLDSLLSMVQMPSGIPVATVTIGGAKNAALLAVRIIGAGDEAMRLKVEAYQQELAQAVREKDAKVRAEFGG